MTSKNTAEHQVTSHPIVDFGYAVRQARLGLGLSLTDAAAEILENPDRKGYVSQVEKGTRNLSPETIDKFAQYFDLDDATIKAAHLAPPLPKQKPKKTKSGKPAPEPKAPEAIDRDAEKLISQVRRDESSPQMGETLMIALAYEFAGAKHRDLHTSYVALRQALEAAQRLRTQGELRGSNAASHLDLVLAEVAQLNEELRFDEAEARFDAEEKRMREDHAATAERQKEEARQLLERRLDQDRLRNDPETAAQRLIKDLRTRDNRGKLFWAIFELSEEWRIAGDRLGDMFRMRVALALARDNYEKRGKGKRAFEAASLHMLGICHERIGERSSSIRSLEVARDALNRAQKRTSKSTEPENWGRSVARLAHVKMDIGERLRDEVLLHEAITHARAAISIAMTNDDVELKSSVWQALGNTLQKLGELTRDPEHLAEAVSAQQKMLEFVEMASNPFDWAAGQSNLGLAQRWLGEVTQDLDMLQTARDAYTECETTKLGESVPFTIAQIHWNIADLALARYALEPKATYLTEARQYLSKARAFFVDGSEHQTERCDELLAKLAAFEAASGIEKEM